MSERNRKILGPINNFKPLTIETSQYKNINEILAEKSDNNFNTGSVNAIKYSKTKFKAIDGGNKGKSQGFPILFQFY